jgi:hypothetical protein
MSYYILPKINNELKFSLKVADSSSALIPYISSSLLFYYNELMKQLKTIIGSDIDCSNVPLIDVVKATNPYEFIFSKIPGTKLSVSKLKPNSNIIYDLLEIFNSTNVLEKFKDDIKSIIFSHNSKDVAESIGFLRDNLKYNDSFDCLENLTISNLTSITNRQFHFIFYESNNYNFNEYLCSLIQILLFILRYQINGGVCIIKIHSTFDKPIIDIIYILTTLYEKTYIVKPNTNNVTTFEKYIVCKGFYVDDMNINILKQYYSYLTDILFLCKNSKGKNIVSLIDFEIPCYFVNKLDDINIIIGQQQLETINIIISILKNKNREEKIESLRKTNIQKCILWCEKIGIPHNKFGEKINIFLPTNCNFKNDPLVNIDENNSLCEIRNDNII